MFMERPQTGGEGCTQTHHDSNTITEMGKSLIPSPITKIVLLSLVQNAWWSRVWVGCTKAMFKKKVFVATLVTSY